MVKMALYIIVSVLFGYIIGKLYSNAKNREIYNEKEVKYIKIISEKNAAIIKLKSDLRSSRRKVDAINQGYELQSKLLVAKERDLKEILEKTEDYKLIKVEHRTISKELSDKIKIIDDKDEIIAYLEKKITQVTREKV